MERCFSDPEGKQFFWVAQTNITHRFQKTGSDGIMDTVRTGSPALFAFQEACGDIEGIRALGAANMAAEQVWRITGKTGYPELKYCFDKFFLNGKLA